MQKELIYYGAQEYYRNSYGMPISNQKVSVHLELKNSKENRLGIPLPKGKVRVYKADRSGSQQLIGEDWIDHTPKDERVKIKLGNAFDVVGERVQKDWRKLASNLYEVEWEISLRNHKAEEQTVTVIEPVPGDWQVLQSSHAVREGGGPHPPVPDRRAEGRRGQAHLPGAAPVLRMKPPGARGTVKEHDAIAVRPSRSPPRVRGLGDAPRRSAGAGCGSGRSRPSMVGR